MTRSHVLAGAAPLLAAWPAHAAAADLASSWSGGEVGGVAVLGVLAAAAWHQIAGHRGDLAERWHHVHLADRLHQGLRHALAYAHARRPERRSR